MSKILRTSLSVILLVSTVFIGACSEDELDTITLKVICEGSIGGYYSVNGGTLQSFSPTTLQGSYTVFEREFDDLDYIEVNAERSDDDDLLEVKIYREGSKVKEDRLDSSDVGEVILYLEYTYGEEETT